MSYSNSANERIYIQKEASFGVIPNSTGTPTLANGDACRHRKATLNAVQGIITRPDKTGTLSATIGIGGRKAATWSLEMSLASSVAGTVPDCDPLLEALFGKAGAVGTGPAKVTYELDDASPSLSIWSFRTPAALVQRVGFGCVAASAQFTLGQDIAMLSVSGPGKYVLDTGQQAVLTDGDAAKGGLTGATFVTEPSAPVTSGIPVIGFTGVVTLDTNVYATVRNATVRINTGRAMIDDAFNNYFALAPFQRTREVLVDFSIYDDDSANAKALLAKAFLKTPVDLIFAMGTVAGNTWTFTLNDVLLPVPEYDDSSDRYALNFSGCRAYASSDTAKDEIKLVIT